MAELGLYVISDQLHIDIDVIRTWPMSKVRGYLTYFEMKNKEMSKVVGPVQKPSSDGGYQITRRGDKMVLH